ncbi:MAG: hypothetical protein U9N63_07435 [Pseudomonadota bacterium]|nr:hypothetical protein [Pseudomonadota bacterium]
MENIDHNLLKTELWRRAARHFAQADLHSESAAAWLAAGHNDEAINALLKTDDRAQTTALLLKAGRYKEAAEQARLWLKEIKPEPKRQSEEKIRALLLLATALHLDLQPDQALTAYDNAREKLSQLSKELPPLTNGKNWEALAAYGVMVKRPDLVRLGYEKALATYGQTLNLQRLRALEEYLEKVADDFYLSQELKERRADWQPKSTLKKERERLWEAVAEFEGDPR